VVGFVEMWRRVMGWEESWGVVKGRRGIVVVDKRWGVVRGGVMGVDRGVVRVVCEERWGVVGVMMGVLFWQNVFH
jgi:hypothetical protein